MERVCLSVAFMEETVKNGAVLVRVFMAWGIGLIALHYCAL